MMVSNFELFPQTGFLHKSLVCPDVVGQGFSKSGLWSESGPGGNSIRTRLHLIFQAQSYHSDLRAAHVAHTHTHTRAHEPVLQ